MKKLILLITLLAPALLIHAPDLVGMKRKREEGLQNNEEANRQKKRRKLETLTTPESPTDKTSLKQVKDVYTMLEKAIYSHNGSIIDNIMNTPKYKEQLPHVFVHAVETKNNMIIDFFMHNKQLEQLCAVIPQKTLESLGQNMSLDFE